MFYEVNTDGEGGVSLEEFEAWWKGLLEKEVRAAGGTGGTACTDVLHPHCAR